MFYINRAGNGNPPPVKPRRSEVPQEQDPVDDTQPADVPPAQPK